MLYNHRSIAHHHHTNLNTQGLADPMGAKKTALTHYMKCVDSLKAYLLESGKQGENMMEHQPHPNCVCKTCTEEVSELEKEMQVSFKFGGVIEGAITLYLWCLV